jgi:ribosome-binding factor A
MGEVVRHALAETLARGDVRDPDLAGVAITITEVRPSPDLKTAMVFVTPLGGQGDMKLILKALKRAKGYFRSELGKVMTSKFTPELRFVEDDAFDRGARLNLILDQVAHEQEGVEQAAEEASDGAR